MERRAAVTTDVVLNTQGRTAETLQLAAGQLDQHELDLVIEQLAYEARQAEVYRQKRSSMDHQQYFNGAGSPPEAVECRGAVSETVYG